MNDLLVLAGGFAATVCAIEVSLTRKLQSALGRVIGFHCAGLIASFYFTKHVGAIPVFIFWSGMFTWWFGIRSHVESSILLRMIHFLRDGPSTRGEMLARYNREYGQASRLEELVRAGLIARAPHGIRTTVRGRFVMRVAALLR